MAITFSGGYYQGYYCDCPECRPAANYCSPAPCFPQDVPYGHSVYEFYPRRGRRNSFPRVMRAIDRSPVIGKVLDKVLGLF